MKILSKKSIVVFVALHAMMVTHPFAYDAAIYAAQKGDIKSADQQLRTMVTHSPDNAQVLYDAGVIADKLNNTQQAAAYFSRAAEYAGNDKNLQFQAYFNAANASVAHKDLKNALTHYDKALVIKPENEYARHNRDRVAQMLKEQEKNDQQKKKNDKNEQKENDNENNDQQGQQEKDNTSGDDGDQEQQNNDNGQQEGKDQQQKNNNNSSDDGLNEKSQSEQGKDSAQDSKREEGKQQGNKEKGDQNSANNQERDSEQDFDKKSDHADDKGEKQQGKQHKKTPEKENIAEDNTSLSSDDKQGQDKDKTEQGSGNALQDGGKEEQNLVDAQQEKEQELEKKLNDPWLLNVLNDQEMRDKAMNKRLMEAKVRQYGGKNGQNNW